MFHKQDLKEDLKAQAEKGRISKTEANRQYIRGMTGKAEHIYRGDLPFPNKVRGISDEILATRGPAMYLYTQDW